MVYLIYGSDIGQSRGFLRLLKDKAPKEVSFSFIFNQKIDPKNFLEKVSNASLFGGNLSYFLEFSKAEHLGEINEIKAVVSALLPSTVVFWVGENIDKRSLLLKFFSANKNCEVKVFNAKPVNKLYPLADALILKDKNSFALANSLIEKNEDVLPFLGLLFQSFYSMLAIKSGATTTINPFVAQKLKPNANKFADEKIKEILSLIYKTELCFLSGVKDPLGEVFNLVSFILKA